jgi:diguanylate cyclase (GGDEF)-like protein
MGSSVAASTARQRLLHRLAVAPWLVAALGVTSSFVLPGGASGPAVRGALLATLALFFALLVARLVLAASTYRSRRLSLLFLAMGVTLWAAGSATVSASQTVAAVTFPAPGEILYLLSYLGMAAFLLLDIPRGHMPRAAVWFEASAICGAATCLAAVTVLTPLSTYFARDGLPLLLAILYPVIDLLLAAMVLGQFLLRQRDASRRTAGLAAGFLGLALADSSFLVNLATHSYSTNVLLDAVWGCSFAVLVGAAVSRPRTVLGRSSEPNNSRLMLASTAVALALLVLHPDGDVSWFVIIPAVVTLVCAGGRLVLALRESEGAAEALRLSLTDELTGLPNRRALLAATGRGLASDEPVAFMLLDLDGFKDINDSLGHEVGDQVLEHLAQRLRTGVRHDVLIGRLGGDEFAVLAKSEDELKLLAIAHDLRELLKEPLTIGSLDVSIDASIGITVRRPGDVGGVELLRRADIAMYEAKQMRAGALLFDTTLDGVSHQRLRRIEDLRQALADNQFTVWYQPQVDARTGQVVAMEALIRWQHPTEGLLAPMAFLPDARQAGFMPALSEAVLNQAVRDARRWAEQGHGFRVAMNCAPPELLGGRLLPLLFERLADSGLPRDRFLIEMTEDSFLANPEHARDALYELRAHDVQASIDDYGTGFSSLAYLRDLPVQELKLDRSFISTMLDDPRSRMIVQTTATMAHALDMRLVAEGVEDAATAAELVVLDVDILQGYHIARPMPADQVDDWVLRWSSRAALPRSD